MVKFKRGSIVRVNINKVSNYILTALMEKGFKGTNSKFRLCNPYRGWGTIELIGNEDVRHYVLLDQLILVHNIRRVK